MEMIGEAGEALEKDGKSISCGLNHFFGVKTRVFRYQMGTQPQDVVFYPFMRVRVETGRHGEISPFYSLKSHERWDFGNAAKGREEKRPYTGYTYI